MKTANHSQIVLLYLGRRAVIGCFYSARSSRMFHDDPCIFSLKCQKYKKKTIFFYKCIFELSKRNIMSENSTNDEYAHVAKGPLKLKNDPTLTKKKKNKKSKEKKMVEVAKIIEEEKPKPVDLKRTKAELAFQKMQEKMQTERIKQKASMTHKQRVEEFNRHLDSLTEHFDIPKVSWTK